MMGRVIGSMRLPSIRTRDYQEKFFDKHPRLYPWLDLFSCLLLPPLGVLEIPWKKLGCSNRFFILGRKR